MVHFDRSTPVADRSADDQEVMRRYMPCQYPARHGCVKTKPGCRVPRILATRRPPRDRNQPIPGSPCARKRLRRFKVGWSFAAPPADETVSAQSHRTLARAFAWSLLAEDPQRRLDARAVSALAHQASLVRHLLSTPALHRVLIADEVGLGKMVEAALIIKELADGNPGLRVLYLAPAGLVRNVQRELTRIGLHFRWWIAGDERDARLTDSFVPGSGYRPGWRRAAGVG